MSRKIDSTDACEVFRDNIFVQKGEYWYFNTREGHQFGPYSSKQQAVIARQWFVYSVTQDESLKPSLEETEDLFREEHIELSDKKTGTE